MTFQSLQPHDRQGFWGDADLTEGMVQQESRFIVGLGNKHLKAVQAGVFARLCSICDLSAG